MVDCGCVRSVYDVVELVRWWVLLSFCLLERVVAIPMVGVVVVVLSIVCGSLSCLCVLRVSRECLRVRSKVGCGVRVRSVFVGVCTLLVLVGRVPVWWW